MTEIYANNKIVVWLFFAISPICLCMLHFFFFRKQESLTGGSEVVKRFNRAELFFHWVKIIAFLILVGSGLVLAFNAREESHPALPHALVGIGLLFIFIVYLIAWFKYVLFRNYDWIWFKNLGGYLSQESPSLPAGRFNAGQKVFFWLILLFLIGLLVTAIAMEHGEYPMAPWYAKVMSIHGFLAGLMTAMIIAHAYLSILVNPNTIQVLFRGKISRSYVEHHHPNWKPDNLLR
ncbi:MAG: hypothetical protein CVU90_00430 [Firmicutes bacterium HGW-Firmicutes-15]|nr:MAG: hypothetical protein CVU90_00430 [Firmicutes bacterium HGW-Firmicutes-15]